ncbi:hypothetical protein D1007_24056 [Hordeum vulgare]|nr:hypothetical protein D1007_24056 [Hordeum vulgare]
MTPQRCRPRPPPRQPSFHPYNPRARPGDEPRTKTPITDDENTLGAPRATHTAPASGAVVLPSAMDSFNDIIAQADGKMILLFLDYDDSPSRPSRCGVLPHFDPDREIRSQDQPENFQPLPELEPLVTQATERLDEAVQGIENASVENNKFCVSVHYREVDERDWRLVEDIVNNVLLDFPDLERASGDMVWEVRPKAKFNKGDALDHLYRYLLQHLQVESSQVLAIHIGDDTTDENAFSMLREKGYGFGIRVQTEPKLTEATYSLKDPYEVMGFLKKLVKWKKLLSGNSPPRINKEANIKPLVTQQSRTILTQNSEIQHEPFLEENSEHDDENDDLVLHGNNLGDLDKYNLQETMDHSIPYSRGYASESDDDGPDEEVDEEGFTTKEAEAFTKVLGRDHRTPLFEDLSLADEAVVDGGEGILFGVRPTYHRDKHVKNIILPGSKVKTFLELKMWLDEYSVMHYRPHKVVHSNMKLRYMVACEDS